MIRVLLIVHSLNDPSALTSNDPVPSPPKGIADLIPIGGCNQIRINVMTKFESIQKIF
jgi:hypothetical protein